MVADCVAIIFAAGTLIVSFGSSAIFASLATSVSSAIAFGLGATATAGSFKLIIDAMDLSELNQLIAELRAQGKDQRTAHDQFAKVDDIFAQAYHGVNQVTGMLQDMDDTLNKVDNIIGWAETATFTTDDARRIGKTWGDVEVATALWLTIINAQETW
eukprot:503093-Heterocapsa_arctica.AAC.1